MINVTPIKFKIIIIIKKRGRELFMGEGILGSEKSQFKDLRAGACWTHLRNSRGNKCKGFR